MPYAKLLKKIMEETNTTNKDIEEKSILMKKPIDRTYISKIKNGKLPAPTEEKSKIISKICEVDNKYLILEGYIDTAPKEIIEMLRTLQEMVAIAGIGAFANSVDEDILEEMIEVLREETLSEFVISILENKDYTISTYKDMFKISAENDKLNFNLGMPISFPVKDNSMFPLIPKGAKVILEIPERYVNGDIIFIREKKTKKNKLGVALIYGRNVTLVPMNKAKYKEETYFNDEILILGKIKTVITDI